MPWFINASSFGLYLYIHIKLGRIDFGTRAIYAKVMEPKLDNGNVNLLKLYKTKGTTNFVLRLDPVHAAKKRNSCINVCVCVCMRVFMCLLVHFPVEK